MIDLHIHLLPGIDDGSPSPEVTTAMLEMARSLGFTTLVATPHLPGRLDPTYAARIDEAFARTQAEATGFGIEVRRGFEAALTPDLPRRLGRGEPATLAGTNVVLVDLPFGDWPLHADTTLFSLQTAGFRPVLAHPERYAAVQKEPERAMRLAERGILLQVTVGSFAGIFGKAARRTAEELLVSGAIQIAATDAHSAGSRYLAVPEGLERIAALVGAANRDVLLRAAPEALLAGSPLPRLVLDHPRTPPRGLRDRMRRWFGGDA